MEQVQDILINALLVVIPVVVAVLANAARLWLKQVELELSAEVGAKEWLLIKEWTATAIKAAEQITGLETNEAKKQWVLKTLIQLADQAEFSVSLPMLEAIVEGVFRGLKDTGVIRSG